MICIPNIIRTNQSINRSTTIGIIQYLGEAYEALQKLSADDIKRLEYEEREKALKDYNTQIGSAERRGEKRGIKKGIRLTKQVLSLHDLGKSEQEIAVGCGCTVAEVREILE